MRSLFVYKPVRLSEMRLYLQKVYARSEAMYRLSASVL